MMTSEIRPGTALHRIVIAVMLLVLIAPAAWSQNALSRKKKPARKYTSLIIRELPARDKSKRVFVAVYTGEAKEQTGSRYNGVGFGLLLVGDRAALKTQVLAVNGTLAKAGKGINTSAVKSRIDNAVSALASQFRVRQLDENELKAVIGGPAFRGSKSSLAMNRDVDNANAVVAGLGGVATGAGAIGGYVATTGGITPAVAVASADLTGIVMGGAGGSFLGAGLGAVVGAVGIAAAGGLAIGTGADKVAGAIISWWTNGEENSIGGALASAAEDDDATPAQTTQGGNSGGDTNSGQTGGDSQSGASGAGGSEGSSGDDGSGDDGTSNEDDSSTDDQSGQGGGDSEGGSSGTANPMNDENSDPSRVLTFAIATGLGKGEANRILKALDTKGGGALGASRSTITLQQILTFDAAFGGMYMRSVNRSLAARRGGRGFRESARVGGELRMIYDGVTDPANISAKVNSARFVKIR